MKNAVIGFLTAVLLLVAIGGAGAGGAGDSSNLVGGIATAAAPTHSENTKNALSTDLGGALRVTSASSSSVRDVYVNDAGVELAISHATLNLASASATQIVASAASNQIVVVGFKISASAATNIKWVDDTGGTPDDLSNVTYLSANGGWTAGYPEGGAVRLYATTSGENLGVDASTADAISVEVWYVTEPD